MKSARSRRDRMRARTSGRTLRLFTLIAILAPSNLRPAELVVTGKCTLTHAIHAANDDSTAGGRCLPGGSGADTLVLTENVELMTPQAEYFGDNGLPFVTTEITISGEGFTVERAVDAPSFRIFAVAMSGTLTLNDLVVTRGYLGSYGYGTGNGGAIFVRGGRVTLNNSLLTDNFADAGGAIENRGGTLTLSNTTLRSNETFGYPFGRSGGGIHGYGTLVMDHSVVENNRSDLGGGGILHAGRLVMRNSTIRGNFTGHYFDFSDLEGDGGGLAGTGDWVIDSSVIVDNSGYEGGGIHHGSGDIAISNSTVSGNTGRVLGGGILNTIGSMTIDKSLVSNNTTVSATWSGSGAGIFNTRGGTLSITNSTVSSNIGHRSYGYGGGIANDASLTLTNSTVVNNSARSYGGIAIEGSSATVTVMNSIVANNFAGLSLQNCGAVPSTAAIDDGGNNFSDDTTCGAGFSPIIPDVEFDTQLQDNGGPTLTHQLLDGSVALDAAGDCSAPTDQRGYIRPYDATGDGVPACDSGAYELELELDLAVDSSELNWSSNISLVSYDVISGDLLRLRTGEGQFATAVLACIVNDLADTVLAFSDTPAPGEGFWFLARGINAATQTSYDGWGVSQTAPRDDGIEASGLACP